MLQWTIGSWHYEEKGPIGVWWWKMERKLSKKKKIQELGSKKQNLASLAIDQKSKNALGKKAKYKRLHHQRKPESKGNKVKVDYWIFALGCVQYEEHLW